MKKYFLFMLFAIAVLFLMGFSSVDGKTSGAIIGAIAGAIGAGISYFLFKDEKSRSLATTVIFLAIFFGTKNFLLPYYYAATLDSDLKHKYPIYSTIATYYPKEYNEFLEKMKKNTIENGSLENEIRYSATLANYATEKSIPFASAKNIYNYLNINYQFEKKLYSINPILVLAIESPTRVPSQHSLSSILRSIPESDLTKVLQAKAELIESGSKDRKPINFSDAEIERTTESIKQILASLTEKYGEETVNDTFTATTPFKNQTQSAQVMLSFYELILAKGEEEGGLVFKILYLLGLDDQKEKSN